MFTIVSKYIVDNTNNEAKRYLRQMGSNTGIESDTFFLVSDRQTNAKGRCDRQWQSNHHNIAVTFAVPRPAGCTSLLPFYANTLFIIQSILSEFVWGRPVELKWPNDIFIERKKIGCILIEYDQYEIYIGMNINQNLLGKDVGCPAVDIKKYNGNVRMSDVIRRVTEKFSSFSYLFESSELMGWVTQNYNLRVNTTYQNIEVCDDSGNSLTESGLCLGIDSNGKVLLHNKDGITNAWGIYDAMVKD